MAEKVAPKSTYIAKTVVYGLASAALYFLAFSNEATIMNYFTRGGAYAALPIATVFVFSFVHAAFAGNLWASLGINARKGAEKRAEKTARPTTRADNRPALQA